MGVSSEWGDACDCGRVVAGKEIRRESCGADLKDSRDSALLSLGLYVGVNAEGAAPGGREGSSLTPSAVGGRSLGPCKPPLDLRRMGAVRMKEFPFESIKAPDIVFGEVGIEGIAVSGGGTMNVLLVTLVTGALSGVGLVGVAGLDCLAITGESTENALLTPLATGALLGSILGGVIDTEGFFKSGRLPATAFCIKLTRGDIVFIGLIGLGLCTRWGVGASMIPREGIDIEGVVLCG